MLGEERAWAEVDLAALRANVTALRASLGPSAPLLAVVKADAYGHGMIPVAQTAIAVGVAWLGVATTAEGAALRAAGIDASIVLLCAPPPGETQALLEHRLIPTIGNHAQIEALAEAARIVGRSERAEIHLDLDTGMGRSGALPAEAVGLWQASLAAGLRVTGLTTHFADADGEEEGFSRAQETAFRAARAALEQAGACFDHIHLSCSAALLRFGVAGGNLVRPGLLLYGMSPLRTTLPTQTLPITPVLTLKACVATVRKLPAGHPISYGVTHRLTRPSRVATVLIGYGDGYPRRLSNRGSVLLHGKRAPILGRVCMDQMIVDVTDIPAAAPGDAAVCIGAQGNERISVEE